MVTTAQNWVLLGILGVFAGGIVTLMAYSQQSLRGYIDAKFDAVGTRFDAVDARTDSIDRDVQTLADRFFRDRS